MTLLARPEARAMAALGALVAVGWGAVAFGERVAGAPTAFDLRGMAALRDDAGRAFGSVALEAVARDVTALGSPVVLTAVVVVVVVGLALGGRMRSALFLAGASGGGALLMRAVKAWVDRPRPALRPLGDHVTNASFPSGHAMAATVIYVTLAMLLAHMAPRRSVRVWTIAVALALAAAIGVSRVALGVHWPTDVLAGWTLGLAWSIACWEAAERFDLFVPRAPVR